MNNKLNKKDNFIIYTTENNNINVEVFLEDENLWMNQEQISKLFEKAKSTINEHIKNIYEEGELKQEKTMKKFGNTEFSTKPTNYYNLEMIIAIGYRVKSIRGTHFRIWANNILKNYLVKGYNLDVKRFKNNGGGIQNKMHYAVHGNTAAEVIFNRVDSEKENIGLTSFQGNMPTKAETEIAKNYLTLE